MHEKLPQYTNLGIMLFTNCNSAHLTDIVMSRINPGRPVVPFPLPQVSSVFLVLVLSCVIGP